MLANYNIRDLNASFYVPSFHANAHVMSCIAKYHPKGFPILGNIDGEDLERLWSTIGNFSPIVRNMSKEGRREQLEGAFLAARRRGLGTLGERLIKKFRTTLDLITLKEECLESLRPSSVSKEDFDTEIRGWIENGVIQDPEKPVPLIQQLKAFVISRYRLLKSRKEKRGQVCISKKS